MYRAPAVSFPIVKSWRHFQVRFALWLVGCAVGAVFLSRQWSLLALVLVMFSGTAAGMVAWLGWRNAPTGVLQWDGALWHWTGLGDPSPCRVALTIDLQLAMGVRVFPASGRSRWLWLERASANGKWLALRRALTDNEHFASKQGQALVPVQETPGAES